MDNELIMIGMNVGLYLAATLIQEGFPTDKFAMEAFRRVAANAIEEASGMPAEDFALSLQKIIDDLKDELINAVKESKDHYEQDNDQSN